MNNKNICKFPVSVFSGNPLSISCFVKETDIDIMSRPSKLTQNRMLLVIEGEGTLLVENSPFKLKRGTLLFCFEEESVSLKEGKNLTYMYISFSGMRANELLRQFHVNYLSRIFEDFDGLIPLWQESLFRASDETVELVAESILLYSFSRLYDSARMDNGLLGKIIELTEQNFKDPDLSIATIAEELSYHPKYLSHFFKEKSGVSFSEFLRSVRLKYAIALFDHGIDSIKNVALLSGFSEPLYFSSVFKKSIGLSPKEYIKKASKAHDSEENETE